MENAHKGEIYATPLGSNDYRSTLSIRLSPEIVCWRKFLKAE